MDAVLISVGTELVTGHVVDTNAAWLSEELTRIGAFVIKHVTVADEVDRIQLAVRGALDEAELVMVTGGLGPTPDDLTREAIAKALAQPLEENAEARAQIEAFFQRWQRPMPDSNRVQAGIPRGCTVIPNPRGTAPGIGYHRGGVGFAALSPWKQTRTRKVALAMAVALLALTPGIYALTPMVARKLNVLRRVAHNKPYRDDYDYLFLPWSVVERSAERMSRQAVELAGDRGLIIVEDRMAGFAIHYQAIRAGLDERHIIPNAAPGRIIEAVDASRPVVLVPRNVDAPRTEPPIGRWRRVGDLYVLSPPPE